MRLTVTKGEDRPIDKPQPRDRDAGSPSSFHRHYDVVVVGLGHAGCEAALASARRGARTLGVSMNLDTPALMPCNPSVGGVGKTHLVRELDALGGVMGQLSDQCALSFKVLNTSRGPAVQAVRAVIDKRAYTRAMRNLLESQPLLDLVEDEAVRIAPAGGGLVGVWFRSGWSAGAKSVVVATGTYMESDLVIGPSRYRGGPHGQRESRGLSESLRAAGLPVERLQTATPPRVLTSSIDLAAIETVESDSITEGFAHRHLEPFRQKAFGDTGIVHAGDATAAAVRENLGESPLVLGNITDKGPRHCPSIDRKVMRFPGKHLHRIFLEPETSGGEETYLAGLSTGISVGGQKSILATVPGFEKAWITRYAYAIEYDYLNPCHMSKTLESKAFPGLFTAGQINGTSGYEEAAAQGLLAGINAAGRALGEEALSLSRLDAYLGVLVDDLIVRPLSEPYRMVPSFVENRLGLRCDNACFRLTPIGRTAGLIDDLRWGSFVSYREAVEGEFSRLREFRVNPTRANRDAAASLGGELAKGVSAAEMLRRQGIGYHDLPSFGYEPLACLPPHAIEHICSEIKYEGYSARHVAAASRSRKLDGMSIPPEIDFEGISTLSFRARKGLKEIRPETVGQASRIEGVSPADVTVLIHEIEKWLKGRNPGG